MKKNAVRKYLFLPVLYYLFAVAPYCLFAQSAHPHILVKPQDKPLILDKMARQPWAKKVFDNLLAEVSPYVKRHQTGPEWFLSRYLMNWVPGKRHTRFISDEDGTALTGYAGDAPYPTLRVSPHKRTPVTSDGYGYKLPSLEDLLPYDTSMKMLLTSQAPGGKKEWVDPQNFVEVLFLTCYQVPTQTIKGASANAVFLQEDRQKKSLLFHNTGSGLSINLPANTDGELLINH